jgi:hypothetical protein
MAFVQAPAPYAGESTSSGAISNTFGSANTAGNCLFAFISWYSFDSGTGGDTVACSGVTDTQGNTWTLVDHVDDLNEGQGAALYVCQSCIGGSAATVTAALNGVTVNRGMLLAEYSDATAIDTHTYHNAANTTAADNLTTGSVSTSAGGEQVLGFFTNTDNDGTLSAGTGYTARTTMSGTFPELLLEDITPAIAGTISLTATCGSAGRYAGFIVALSGGSGGNSSGLVASYTPDGAYTSGSSSKSVSVTTQAGDYLVVYGGSENGDGTLSTPSGNSIIFTEQQAVEAGSTWATAYIWTGVDSAGGTWTLSTSCSDNTLFWGFTCLVFRGVGGFGTSLKDNTSGGAAYLNPTTTQNNSAIVVFAGDYNAVNGSSRTWLTINSITPSAANGLETTYARQGSTHFTAYGGYYTDAGTIGTVLAGLSAPTGQKYSIVAQEVLAPTTTSAAFYWLTPYLGGSLEFTEDFEGGADGTSVNSTTNPTGFETPGTPGGSGTIDASMFVYGSKSLRVSSDGGSGNYYYLQHHFSTAQNQAYLRFLLFLPSLPSSNIRILAGTTTADSEATDIVIYTTGYPVLFNAGSSVVGGTASVPIGQWFCMEYLVDSAAQQQTLKVYTDASGTSLQQTVTLANNYDGLALNSFKIGIIATNNYTYWLDSVAASQTGWVGPP